MARTIRRRPRINKNREPVCVAAVLLLVWLCLPVALAGVRDPMAPREQHETAVDEGQLPEFDAQRRNVPQSLFAWIVMAKGYEVEWDSFGRKGWYTQDPKIKPVEPGTSVFPADTAAIYIVFEVPPLEDPATFAAQWYLLDEQGKPAGVPAGKDSLFVPWHEKQGFLELKRPSQEWAVGRYLVKLYITPEGQQPFHAANLVGTMRFTITAASSPPASPGTAPRP